MLHKEFSQRLPDKLAELAEATRAATLDRSCVNTARMLAHRLRGSAGSYGHPAVGATAGIIEELLAEVDIDGVDRQFLWKELEQALHDAHAAVASVVTARSADEAIQGASAQPLVAAIPEVHLDQEDSFGCARRLRGALHDAELPIAISSTDSSLETRAVAVAAGEVRVCDTPITEEHLGELGLGLVRESGAR